MFKSTRSVDIDYHKSSNRFIFGIEIAITTINIALVRTIVLAIFFTEFCGMFKMNFVDGL